jgi:hypothetical protein
MSEIQLLRSPVTEPTDANIAACLGIAHDAYRLFVDSLKSHGIDLEWRYYTDGKAWLGKGLHRWTGVRGGQKEMTAFWLSIWEGFFKVTVYVPEKNRADALTLPIDDDIRQRIADKSQMGKLKFFPVTFDLRSEESLGAVYTLIDFRKTIR